MNHFSALPERHQQLVSREDDHIAKIEKLFTESNMVVLSGVSGVGKSTLACEFAHYIVGKKESIYHVAKWFESDCLEKLEVNYIANMIPSELKHLLVEKNKGLVIQEINKELTNQTVKSKILIVFDGLNDVNDPLFELIYKDLPENIRCLVTTNQVTPKKEHKLRVLEIRPFSKREAELYITKSIPKISIDLVNKNYHELQIYKYLKI